MAEGPMHLRLVAGRPPIGDVLERERAEQARATLRAMHARMFPGGCAQRCADCRARLAAVERVPVADADGIGGWEGIGVALGGMALALVIGLAWLALSGRFLWV